MSKHKVIDFSLEKVESVAIFFSDLVWVAFIASLFLPLDTMLFRHELYFVELQILYYFSHTPTVYLQ